MASRYLKQTRRRTRSRRQNRHACSKCKSICKCKSRTRSRSRHACSKCKSRNMRGG